jgi:hypothetical protein
MSRLLSFIACQFLLVSLSGGAFAQSALGTWDLDIDAGGSHYPSVLTLSVQADTLVGTFGGPGEVGIPLHSISMSGDSLAFAFRNPEHGPMSASVTVGKDALAGSLRTGYGDFPMSGTRKAASSTRLSRHSTLGALMANEKARAILDRHVPGMTSHPQIGDAAGMSLEEMAEYTSGALNNQVLQAIDAELSEL